MLWIALPIILLNALYLWLPNLHSSLNPVLAALLTGLVLSAFYRPYRQPSSRAQTTVRGQKLHSIQQYALRGGIVLFALKVDPALLLNTDLRLFACLLLLVVLILATAIWLGIRCFGLPKAQVLLISAGFSFCGTSAIFATQSLQRSSGTAKAQHTATQAELSQSLALVMLAGLLALLGYNALAYSGWFDNRDMAWLIGSTAPEVSQAVAAAGQLGGLAALAITIKLARVCLLAPFLLGLSRWQHGNARAPIPWFIVGFVALLLLQLVIPLTDTVRSAAALISQNLLMLAMVITGLQSRWQDLKQCQWRTLAFALTVMLLLFTLALLFVALPVWEI